MTSPECFDKTAFGAVLSALREAWDVFAPVRGEDGLRIRRLPADGPVFLGPEKPLLPLKTLFLPTVEDILTFRGGREATTVTPADNISKDRVVFGALGCDAAAIEVLDAVFLGKPADEMYRDRRERTTVIALACTGGGPECFCASCGVNPLHPACADVVLTDTGGAYLFDAVTDKGYRVRDAVGDFLREPTAGERETARSLASFSMTDVPVESVPRDPGSLWDAEAWGELAARCLGCGVCTVLCPTCHCFDVLDERRGRAGRRFRAWDSCMFAGFTLMASGENPRPTKRERVRQRFLHKLSYHPGKHGRAACVGCGRCGRHCPVGIGIDEVIARLSTAEARHG